VNSIRVNSCCSTSCTRLVTLVTNPVISYEWGKYRIGIPLADCSKKQNYPLYVFSIQVMIRLFSTDCWRTRSFFSSVQPMETPNIQQMTKNNSDIGITSIPRWRVTRLTDRPCCCLTCPLCCKEDQGPRQTLEKKPVGLTCASTKEYKIQL
jgi:hypothetical protein